MTDNDKPFACQAKGCNMRFANEDHLVVHTARHEMSLALSASTGSSAITSMSANIFFVDQTPTPTKFLKNCEEVGLFHDLKNPFEEAFKKASNEGEVGSPLPGPSSHPGLASPLPGPHSQTINTPQPMNTPVIPKVVEVQSTSDLEDRDIPHKLFKTKKHRKQSPLTKDTTPRKSDKNEKEKSDNEESLIIVNSSPEPEKDLHNNEHIPVAVTQTGSEPLGPETIASPMENPQLVPSISPVDIPVPQVEVTVAVDNNSKAKVNQIEQQGPVNDPQVIPVPVTMVPNIVSRPTEEVHSSPSTPKSIPSSPVAVPASQDPKQIQVILLQLPTGQTVPVAIPSGLANPQVNFPAAVPLPSPQNVSPLTNSLRAAKRAPVTNVVSSTSQMTKLKLKEALTQNQIPDAVARMNSQQQSPGSERHSVMSPVSPAYSELSEADSSVPYKRRRIESADDDIEERRQKFLERNRAAAARCRDKRKQWINTLEAKSEALENKNSELQNEINKLRDEVVSLKSMLILHKDCNVTKMQLAMAKQAAENLTSAVPTITVSSPADKESASVVPLSSIYPQGAVIPQHNKPVTTEIVIDPRGLDLTMSAVPIQMKPIKLASKPK
ncbi:unnamed protein product [Owenia fusiformis]|uniref:Uncharacterized protein n=1 Tax=Owenia fusiformis TaxID=6347 RepID=A0A8J1TTH4_OWEFU|nr:unnamed protein product [Owenia fusiformis]